MAMQGASIISQVFKRPATSPGDVPGSACNRLYSAIRFRNVHMIAGIHAIMYSRFTPNSPLQRTFSTSPNSAKRFWGISATV